MLYQSPIPDAAPDDNSPRSTNDADALKAKRAIRMMRAIQTFSEHVSAYINLPTAVNAVIESGSQLLGVEHTAVFLIQGGKYSCAASRGMSKGEVEAVVRSLNANNHHYTFATSDALTAWSIETGTLDQELQEVAANLGVNCITVVPMMHDSKLVGLLTGFVPLIEEYGPVEIEMAQTFASLAALVITNARVYKDTKQSEQDANFLSETSRIFDSSLELPLVLQAVVERAKGVIGESCSILLLDKEGLYLEPMASSSTLHSNTLSKLDEYLVKNRVVFGEGLVGQVAVTGKSCLIPDFHSHPLSASIHLHNLDILSLMVVPISAKGRVLGLLLVTTFASSGRRLKERDLRLASSLAERVAIAIENARLFEQVIEGKRVWEQTFDAIADGISIHDNRFRITRANKAFAGRLGLLPRQVIGKKCYEVIYARSAPCQDCPHQRAMLTGQASQSELHESQIGERFVQVTTYPLKDGNGKVSASVHVMKDVTGQKLLQEQLIRSERLRALGEMASGVAHNFNNLLAAILGRAELALMQATDGRVVESLNVIRQAALDGAQTVRRIQDYSRIRKDIDNSLVNLNEVILGAIELARPKWKDEPQRRGISIELLTEIRPVPFVAGNASELREVILNMIFNAVDAMPRGGSLKVRSGQDGSRVMVQIQDSGEGISDENLKRIFDPFYTTKGRLGNGLGLSIAYGIITRQGGEILVSSEMGKGSTFTILLPKAVEQRTGTQPMAYVSIRPAKVLVVDDEPDVLETTELVLREQGHTVFLAHSGTEALETLAGKQVELVITDLGMPEMNGWELARSIKEGHPDLPVALFTGWAVEIDQAQMKQWGVDKIITKPTDSHTLAMAIGELLAENEEEIGPLRILIVDDEKRFGEVLAERLQLDGHDVRTVTDGAKAIEALETWECDTIFTDYKLPDTSGTELASEIKKGGCDCFTVLMTGYAASVNDPAFIKDVDAVLPKPWKLMELDNTLKQAWRVKCSKQAK